MSWTDITWLWTGMPGAPGYTKFHFDGRLNAGDATAAANRTKTFLTAVAPYIPTTVTLSCQSIAEQYDGNKVGEVTLTTTPTAVPGSGSGAYAGASGMVVQWLTGAFYNGRAVRGRSFLVPAAQGAYFTDGTIQSSTITAVNAAANTLAGGTPGLTVVHKFHDGTTAYTQYAVNGGSVPDRAAVLRSRRD